jgi:hypothetical protein
MQKININNLKINKNEKHENNSKNSTGYSINRYGG